jgi:hypothetical protein
MDIWVCLAIVAMARDGGQDCFTGKGKSSPRTPPFSKISLPPLTGSLNRRGPALPGLK